MFRKDVRVPLPEPLQPAPRGSMLIHSSTGWGGKGGGEGRERESELMGKVYVVHTRYAYLYATGPWQQLYTVHANAAILKKGRIWRVKEQPALHARFPGRVF